MATSEPPAASTSPDRPGLILIGGGARSGKSRFALGRALRLGPRRVFVATAEPLDQEMTERIARHRIERHDAFDTVEEPLALPQALLAISAADVVLVDCLTLWVSNLLVRGADAPQLQAAFAALEAALAGRRVPVILVTNEVGLGLVPQTALGRAFRDAIGDLHQRLSVQADEVYAALMGMVIRLRPAPIEVVAPAAIADGNGTK